MKTSMAHAVRRTPIVEFFYTVLPTLTAALFLFSGSSFATDAGMNDEQASGTGNPATQEENAGENQAAGEEEKPPCAQCHNRFDEISKSMGETVHKDMGCTDCHSEAEDVPHDKKMTKVACADCHDEAAEAYKQHGRVVLPGEDVPSCSSCHGTHNIFTPADPRSMVHPANITATCGNCHRDSRLLARHELGFADAVQTYTKSVHGRKTQEGSHPFAAACFDCHSETNSGHSILPPGDPKSSINHFNTDKTCGKCHEEEAKAYRRGIHGKLLERGSTDTPTCTGCHGEHGILPHGDERSPVNPARVAEATCTPCHNSARLNEKFDIPSGKLKSRLDTYHGLKSQEGDVTVANCASCHGYHDVLPSSDPDSSINPAHLPETCGKCHKNIHKTIAMTKIHGSPESGYSELASSVRTIYIGFVLAVLISMFIYVLIDARRYLIIHLNKGSKVQRMTQSAVIQHTLLMLSFTVLVFSGFALRFAEAWWVQILFAWEGGFPMRGIIHRIAAAVFLASSLGHAGYLVTPAGRQFLKDMIPKIEDAKHALQLLSFNLTGKGKHPHFRRFGFIEKAEYWALVWGTIVMSITGILLAFENLAAGYFSKEILDILLIVHYYEAWLAAMAIVIWHMYFAVLRPTVYPMNPAWITGSMPRKMYEEEHPADHVALGTGSDHETTTGKTSAAETKTSSDSQTQKSDK